MARVIDTFPAHTNQSRYPWDEWLDGRVWELVQGEDFDAKPNTLKTGAKARSGAAVTCARARSTTAGVPWSCCSSSALRADAHGRPAWYRGPTDTIRRPS